MVMALRTVEGEAQKNSAKCIGAIDGIGEEIFLVDGTTFVGGHMTSIESTGNLLGISRLIDQIPSQLCGDELIKRHVGTEGFDDPVSVGPDGAAGIHVNACSICVASEVQPWSGHVSVSYTHLTLPTPPNV